MSIPDYQSIMLPILKSVKDGATYKITEIKEKLAEVFILRQKEQRGLLPGGANYVLPQKGGTF